MERIKAIVKVIFLIFMEMAIFTFVTAFSRRVTMSEIFTVEMLIGNILFVIIYNPIYYFFTYKRRNSSERGKENYANLRKTLDPIFKKED